MIQQKNRWLIALCAVGIHISIGSVYAWSIFTKPIIQQLGWSLKEVTFTFSIAILFLGLSAAFLGKIIEKKGPRWAGLMSACFYGIGMAGGGLAIELQSLPLLYLFYGVIAGIGLGVGYLAPVSTLVKWFADRPGFGTGLAIMGFGFAAMVAGPILQYLISTVGLAHTFYIMGFVYFLLIGASSLYLAPPPENWQPQTGDNRKVQPVEENLAVSLAEAVKTSRFYSLWAMLFINITCGIAIISVASPMAQEFVHMNPVQAATMVGLIGLFNGGGRILWATVSDYIGRPNTYIAFFVLQIAGFFLLTVLTDMTLFQITLFVIMTCYGGGFAAMPAYIRDVFGTSHLSSIHGWILTAWAAAGVVGPVFTAWIRETTGSYMITLSVFLAFFVVALGVAILTKFNVAKLEAEFQQEQELLSDITEKG